jgi:hypothetical protein
MCSELPHSVPNTRDYRKYPKVFWNVTSCWLVNTYGRLRGVQRLHLPGHAVRDYYSCVSQIMWKAQKPPTCLELCIWRCMNIKWYSIKILKWRRRGPQSQCPSSLSHVWSWRCSEFGTRLKSHHCIVCVCVCVCVCVRARARVVHIRVVLHYPG